MNDRGAGNSRQAESGLTRREHGNADTLNGIATKFMLSAAHWGHNGDGRGVWGIDRDGRITFVAAR